MNLFPWRPKHHGSRESFTRTTNGPAGGFKFKSGRNITIMNNYLRNTGLIMYGTPEIGLAETQAEGLFQNL